MPWEERCACPLSLGLTAGLTSDWRRTWGRSPRTWFKPNDMVKTPQAPYDRCDDFSGKIFKPVWQWNHNPNDKMWSLNKERKGWLRLHSMPAKQLLWAKNTLTQRAIGPVSYTSVKLDASA